MLNKKTQVLLKLFIIVLFLCFSSSQLLCAEPNLKPNATTSTAAAAGKNPPPKILSDFVETLINITPGKDIYPSRLHLEKSETLATSKTFELNDDFSVSSTEVSQALFLFVTKTNPSHYVGMNQGVESVTWDQANQFCHSLTLLLQKNQLISVNEVVRLPYEYEWEYVARAGSRTDYFFGDTADLLANYAWYDEISIGLPVEPKLSEKEPNPWGLYDVYGYNWEWCADTWDDDYQIPSTDGQKIEDLHPLRGGSWRSSKEQCSSIHRDFSAGNTRKNDVGFRCVVAKKGAQRVKLLTESELRAPCIYGVSRENFIAKIDPQTGRVLDSYTMETDPDHEEGLALNGTTLYYINGLKDNKVLTFDSDLKHQTGTLLTQFPPRIDALAVNGNLLYALDFVQNKIHTVDLSSFQIVNTVSLKFVAIGGMTYGGDRNTIFISSFQLGTLSQNKIYEIDPQTGAQLNVFDADYSIFGMAYSNSLKRLFISTGAFMNKKTVALNPDTGAKLYEFEGSYSALAADESASMVNRKTTL